MLQSLLLFTCSATAATTITSAVATHKPHVILLVLADDYGFSETGFQVRVRTGRPTHKFLCRSDSAVARNKSRFCCSRIQNMAAVRGLRLVFDSVVEDGPLIALLGSSLGRAALGTSLLLSVDPNQKGWRSERSKL